MPFPVSLYIDLYSSLRWTTHDQNKCFRVPFIFSINAEGSLRKRPFIFRRVIITLRSVYIRFWREIIDVPGACPTVSEWMFFFASKRLTLFTTPFFIYEIFYSFFTRQINIECQSKSIILTQRFNVIIRTNSISPVKSFQRPDINIKSIPTADDELARHRLINNSRTEILIMNSCLLKIYHTLHYT